MTLGSSTLGPTTYWYLTRATGAVSLLLLTAVPEHVVKAVLAVVIIGFSAYCLAGRRAG